MNKTGLSVATGTTGSRLLTPDDLAVLLRISKTGVYRLIEQRAIRFYRIRGVLRFREDDVNAYLERRCVEPVLHENL